MDLRKFCSSIWQVPRGGGEGPSKKILYETLRQMSAIQADSQNRIAMYFHRKLYSYYLIDEYIKSMIYTICGEREFFFVYTIP